MISSSDLVSVTVFALALTTVFAYPQQQQQQQIDPAYLRDYYAQISQQNARGAASASDATPIYEQEQAQPQYITAGQQQVTKNELRILAHKHTYTNTHKHTHANKVPFEVTKRTRTQS